MTSPQITAQLELIASTRDFPHRSAGLVEEWAAAGVGLETVEPILRFMEEHPAVDYGTPGALVHFVERFYGEGYEGKLVGSVRRRPTLATLWMLNRVINGAREPGAKRVLIAVLEKARVNPLADEDTRASVDRFLDQLSRLP